MRLAIIAVRVALAFIAAYCFAASFWHLSHWSYQIVICSAGFVAAYVALWELKDY